MLPVLVAVMVAVTGFPAGSTVLDEFGIPLLLTGGAAKETVPVNGALRCAPLLKPTTNITRVHRPFAGEPWKNCMVGPGPRPSLTLVCASSGSPFGSTRNPSRM